MEPEERGRGGVRERHKCALWGLERDGLELQKLPGLF